MKAVSVARQRGLADERLSFHEARVTFSADNTKRQEYDLSSYTFANGLNNPGVAL